MSQSPATDGRSLRIVHLFPDLLSTYGDGGNLRALAVRAERRGIHVTVLTVTADSDCVPDGDLFVIGGGQDRDQVRVEAALARLGSGLERRIEEGAALLAVCGGYQSLGRRYRFADGRTVHGPGIFPIETNAAAGRLVGPVVTRFRAGPLGPSAGVGPGQPATIVGFENHSGRTWLDRGAAAFGTVRAGAGNNGEDGTEGCLATQSASGPRGLRIGTYLHGPLLPRNPHIADLLLQAGLARTGQDIALAALDDRDEWRAHDRFLERTLRRSWLDGLPGGLGRAVGPVLTTLGR